MSDYLFMLDNHLNAGQNRALLALQNLASAAGVTLWLTGGAMREMLRGAPIRDLDFTVEKDAISLAKQLADLSGGRIVSEDAWKRGAELVLEGDVHLSIENARAERWGKPGTKPHIQPATIHEDLHRRDFTINAIALSLNRGSRGLLIDPTNGQADLMNHELRTTNSYAFLHDPVRLLRMLRFQHGLQLQVVPRTQSQFENALLEDVHKSIPVSAVAAEIRKLAASPHAVTALDAMAEKGFLQILSSALAGEKRNSAGLLRLEKMAQTVLPGGDQTYWMAFLSVLTEKLNARERAEVIRAFELSKKEADTLRHLDDSVKKLETALRSATVKRPSHVYEILRAATVDEILLLLCRSTQRVVQDRIRAYYSKYLPTAQEVTEEEVLATGAKPGTPKYEKTLRTLVAQRLNARPKKVDVIEAIPAAPIIPAPMVRGARAR